jgi:methyl-accepting chemotaxis protein
MTRPAADPISIRNRIFASVCLTSFPSSLVVGYLIALVLQFPWTTTLLSTVTLLIPMVSMAMAFEWVFATVLTRAAFSAPEGPERQRRLLELPRRMEVLPYTLGWTIGGGSYAAVAAMVFGGRVELCWIGALAGLFAALFLGPILIIRCEDHVRPAVLELALREPGTRPSGAGPFWVRQRWYLPYAFAIALVAAAVFTGIAVLAKWRAAGEHILSHLAAVRLDAAVGLVREDLETFETQAGVPIVVLVLIVLVAFWITGAMLARRQHRAAAEVEASLRAVAAGAPELPRWIATDEIGDLANATAGISSELRHAFEQLRGMAAGDLGRELHGDSGLVQAFRASREAMLELVGRMDALSRGERIAGRGIAGDLGEAFSRLQTSLEAVVEQARTIAGGDLRRDVEVTGALGDALQRMTGNLRGMVGRTQAVSGEVAEIVVNLQSAAAQLSAATTEQVAAVTETANTTTEMAQTSAVAADRASELIRQGDAATAVVEEGGAAAESANHAMGAISTSLGKVAEASAALAERVRKIDDITETVSFLSDQSSTLAINAAIEASRAGEAGKGFSVVAREIRTLAADSRKASSEIRALLAEIRERTKLVDDAVGAGARTVEDGGALLSRLGDVVAQLGSTVHDAVGLMRQVEGSARQHQAGVSQISQALTNLQKASESIRDGAGLIGAMSTRAHDLSSSLQETAGAYTLPGGTSAPRGTDRAS